MWRFSLRQHASAPNGVDVKTVQTRLGHANPSITLGWYAHAIPENDHEAAKMLGSLFNGQAETNASKQEENGRPTEFSSPISPRNTLSGETEISNSEFSSPISPRFLEETMKDDEFKVIRLTA